MNLLIFQQEVHTDPRFLCHLTELCATHVFPDLADKRRTLPQLLQHGEHVARRAAGVCLQQIGRAHV